jgi:hypothetical protein
LKLVVQTLLSSLKPTAVSLVVDDSKGSGWLPEGKHFMPKTLYHRTLFDSGRKSARLIWAHP